MSLTATETARPVRILSPLRWYTGYYSLVGTGSDTLPQGAFIQIISSGNQDSLFDIVSIAISTNGTTVKKYTSGFTIDNVHNKIVIPNIADITLTKNSNERAVSSLQGIINGKTVAGVNYLSPSPLEILVGSYKNPSGTEVLNISKNSTSSLPVFNIEYDFGDGKGMQVIEKYTYDPTMYLLTFYNSKNEEYVLMMGTGEGKGLASYVLVVDNPAANTVLYTIPAGV